MTQEQVVLILVALGSWAATELYKLICPGKPLDPRAINTLVAAGIGAGMAALADAEGLPYALVAAAYAVLGGAMGACLHRAGHVAAAVAQAEAE